jgi:pimeloyl-ACP methyl ester carboxylesterase
MKKRIFFGTTTLLGLAGFNLWADAQARPLMSPLEGGTTDLYTWHGPDGTDHHIFYKHRGAGEPLLLLHGHNAGASTYEIRKQYAGLANDFQVFAPDLLGYGLSDRPPLHYSAETFVALIGDFVREVIGQPTGVIASSLSAAHLIEAVHRAPDMYRRLVLIVPTGLDNLSAAPGIGGFLANRLFRLPILGTALYNGLVSQPSLRWFLEEQAYYDPTQVTDGMIDEYYDATHLPGAKWAPAAFVGGQLNLSVAATYPEIDKPILVVWGRDTTFSSLDEGARFVELNDQARLEIFDRCRSLPHDEYAEQFNQLAHHFLSMS